MLFIPFLYIFARESNKPMKTAEKIRKEILKDFMKFLKDNHVYIQYRSNIAKLVYDKDFTTNFCYGINDRIFHGRRNSFDMATADNLVNHAFGWIYTPEGDQFWRNLHYKWQDFTRKKYHTITIINLLDNGK